MQGRLSLHCRQYHILCQNQKTDRGTAMQILTLTNYIKADPDFPAVAG